MTCFVLLLRSSNLLLYSIVFKTDLVPFLFVLLQLHCQTCFHFLYIYWLCRLNDSLVTAFPLWRRLQNGTTHKCASSPAITAWKLKRPHQRARAESDSNSKRTYPRNFNTRYTLRDTSIFFEQIEEKDDNRGRCDRFACFFQPWDRHVERLCVRRRNQFFRRNNHCWDILKHGLQP